MSREVGGWGLKGGLGEGAGRRDRVLKHGWSGLESERSPHPKEDWAKEKPRSQGLERRWEEGKRGSLQGPHMSNTTGNPIASREARDALLGPNPDGAKTDSTTKKVILP